MLLSPSPVVSVLGMNKPIATQALTRKFFFSLPAGHYLASNIMDAPGQPIFAQTVQPAEQRAAQWQDIVAARANGRLCHVFKSPRDFMAMSLDVPFQCELN